jgi:hypothetical protein
MLTAFRHTFFLFTEQYVNYFKKTAQYHNTTVSFKKWHRTEHHSPVVNTTTLYSGGPAFKSQSGNWLSWLEFFLCFSSDLPDKCWDSTLKSGHDHFLPNPSQFIIHPIISEKALNKLQNQSFLWLVCNFSTCNCLPFTPFLCYHLWATA